MNLSSSNSSNAGPTPSAAEQIRATTLRHAVWTFAWLATTALATFGPALLWVSPAANAAAIALNLAVGAGMVRTAILHIRSLDEFQQKIHIDAMGLTLGVGLVAGIGYSLLSTSGLIPWPAEIPLFLGALSLVYLATVLVQTRRFA